MKTLQRKANRFKGYTIGLDLHQAFIQVVVLDPRGNDADSRRIGFNESELEKLLREWRKRGPVQVAFEACGCFLWVFDLTVRMLGRPQAHAAHAASIRMISQSMQKNDHNDAWWLAYLLYEGRLPEAYVSEGALRELKTAGRELRFWTDTRSDLVRRVRSALAQLGKKLQKGWHTSKVKLAASKAVLDSIKGTTGEALQDLYAEIERLSERIAKWRKIVEEHCKAFPEIDVIQSNMPGIALLLGGLLYGELGSPKRFRSAKAYANATGLTPAFRESGGKAQAVGITRQGSRLARWALTRAVVTCNRCTKNAEGVQVKKWVKKQMERGKPKRKVITAAARKLAEGVWRLLSWGEVFDLKRAFPT